MTTRPKTILDALAGFLRKAAAYNSSLEHPPVVVLWPDGEKRWTGALRALRESVSEFWTLGPYDPENMQGPPIWVKWMLANRPAETSGVPILYMPGHTRVQFRSLEDFQEDLKPLAELQFLGAWWTQNSGKDWTPRAFLESKQGGLGLDFSKDEKTLSAIDSLVPRILAADLSTFKGRRLEADDFWRLLIDDLGDGVLRWMEDPDGTRGSFATEEWQVFSKYVHAELAVDVDRDGPLVAAERLVRREGAWGKVWQRYEDGVPGRYRHVHLVLVRASLPEPKDLFADRSTFPAHNEKQEKLLRDALAGLAQVDEKTARVRVLQLDKEHGKRRQWIWCKLGLSPMVVALEHFAELARTTELPNAGHTPDDVAARYREHGWRADASALAVMALADHATAPVLYPALRALYLPWLRRTADALRQSVNAVGYPTSKELEGAQGECLLFADGLRWDLGMRLTATVERKKLVVEAAGRWTAFPPVTATCKPDVAPIIDCISDRSDAIDFTPVLSETGKRLLTPEFRKTLAGKGIQFLGSNETGSPDGIGWTEFGDIDSYGHEHGAKTARHVEDQLRDLLLRVEELLAAGWKKVRVVTDHGWLLLPDGLPKTEGVVAGLAETRWGRCAVLKSTTQSELPSLPWRWNPLVQITFAPDVTAFTAGLEYTHGGLTLQECYTPVLTVSRRRPKTMARIGEVRWVGLRCRVTVEPPGAGLSVDIRGKVADADSTLAHEGLPRPVDEQGQASVPVGNPDAEGSAAFVVLLAPDGSVVDKRQTTVGGDE